MSHPAFVRNERGHYQVIGEVSRDDIIHTASALLQQTIAHSELMNNAKLVGNYLQLQLAQQSNEQFCVMFLNNQHQLIAFETLFSGTIDQAPVFPRVIVQRALEHNAAAVILAHNHPSGTLEASRADRTITQRIQDALQLIDVRVLDHFIVSTEGWLSFSESGYL